MAPRTTRRPAWALAAALPLLAAILACTGEAPLVPSEPAPEAPVTAIDPRANLVGTWRMTPMEERLRQLKIIDAAISEKAQKRERLGTMNPDELALFDDWAGKKDQSRAEVRAMRIEMRYMRNSLFEFSEDQATLKFGEDEVFGPVPYEVVSATDLQIVITFDPGMGNGEETHTFTWQTADKAIDDITSEKQPIRELIVTRRE